MRTSGGAVSEFPDWRSANPVPSSPYLYDLWRLVMLGSCSWSRLVVYLEGKNAKKFRQGEEYGSARWGNLKDIAPFIDPVFENNILLTQTERLDHEQPPEAA